MSNGEMLYLSLVLFGFFSFVVVLAYGIVSSASARKASVAGRAIERSTAPHLTTPALLKAA